MHATLPPHPRTQKQMRSRLGHLWAGILPLSCWCFISKHCFHKTDEKSESHCFCLLFISMFRILTYKTKDPLWFQRLAFYSRNLRLNYSLSKLLTHQSPILGKNLLKDDLVATCTRTYSSPQEQSKEPDVMTLSTSPYLKFILPRTFVLPRIQVFHENFSFTEGSQ